jgi:VanZ family protein
LTCLQPDSTPQNVTGGVENVFRQGQPVFATLTSGRQHTAVYVNGVEARTFQQFRLQKDMTGRLVIGSSPFGDGFWPGELWGLAIYHSELTPSEVLRHYRTWTRQGQPDISASERPIALYLLRERGGGTVHNAIEGGIDLTIPERYTRLQPVLLEPFWEEYRTDRRYWKDVSINLFGFVPLGFMFYWYWSSVKPVRRAALATIALGFALSLTIEVLQSFLPTRNSGTTDLITNTLGTCTGVALCARKASRALMRHLYPGPKA